MIKIWFIDDKPENHKVWLNSFSDEVKNQTELKCFTSWSLLKAELKEGSVPDILFLDYFLGDTYGHKVIDWFHEHSDIRRPFIAAHGSMKETNTAMFERGADLIVPKIKGSEFTLAIREQFSTIEDISKMLEQ